MVHPFDIVAQPIRRRIIEVLAVGDHTAGELCEVVTVEAGVSRTAVSHQAAGRRRPDGTAALTRVSARPVVPAAGLLAGRDRSLLDFTV